MLNYNYNYNYSCEVQLQLQLLQEKNNANYNYNYKFPASDKKNIWLKRKTHVGLFCTITITPTLISNPTFSTHVYLLPGHHIKSFFASNTCLHVSL